MLIGLALVGLLVAAHVVYRAVVRARFPAGPVFVDAGGRRLHVRTEGAGPPLVLVHGSNGIADDFPAELVGDLAHDHTVRALDRPGHGHSPRGAGTLDLAANARALVALLRATGGEPATLVGHSYGAAVVLRAALDHPELVRAVAAVTPAVVEDPRNARWALAGHALPLVAPLAWVLTLPVGLAISPRVRRAAWHPEPAPADWNASRAFSLCPDQILHAGENARHLTGDLETLAADLPRLAVPLFVIAGGEDRITPPRLHLRPLAAVPGVHVEEWPRLGHWLPRLRPRELAAAIRALEAQAAPERRDRPGAP